jgi:hypothetical protein
MNKPGSKWARKYLRRQRAALLTPAAIAARKADAKAHALAHR